MWSDLIGFHIILVTVQDMFVIVFSWVEVDSLHFLLFFISADNLLSTWSFKRHTCLNARLSFEFIRRSTSVLVGDVLLYIGLSVLFWWRRLHLREITVSWNSFSLFTLIHKVVLLNHCVCTSICLLNCDILRPICGKLIASLSFRGELILFIDTNLSNLALIVLLLTNHWGSYNLVRRRSRRVLAKFWLTLFEFFGWVQLNDTLSLSSESSDSCATLNLAIDLRGHVDIAGWWHHRWLVNFLRCLRRNRCFLYNLTAWTILHFCECEGEANFGVIFIVILKISIILIIFWIVEQSDPLLVLVVLHNRVV